MPNIDKNFRKQVEEVDREYQREKKASRTGR